MNLLPSPTPSEATSLFFPVTWSELGSEHYKFHSCDSSHFRDTLLRYGETGDELLVTQVEYYQLDVPPLQHEFIVVHFKDRHNKACRNYLVIERWTWDVTAAKARTLASSPADSETSEESFESLRFLHPPDNMAVSIRREVDDLDGLEPGKRTLLATLTPPASSTFSIGNLCVLACLVARSDMSAFDDESFYYGRVIWEVIKLCMGSGARVCTSSSMWMAEPLQRAVKKDIKYGAPAMKSKYEATWKVFTKKVEAIQEEQIAETQMQIKRAAEAEEQLAKAAQKTAEAETRTAEAERQIEEAEKRKAEARLRSAEERKRMAESRKRTAEARSRTAEAWKQGAEARRRKALLQKQTDEAKKQDAMLREQAHEITEQAVNLNNEVDKVYDEAEEIDREADELYEQADKLYEQAKKLEAERYATSWTARRSKASS